MNEQPMPNANGYHRPQQTWVCGRDCNACQLGPTRFGNCREKANPCRPKLSLRGQRGLFVIGCTLATVAIMMIGTWQVHLLDSALAANLPRRMVVGFTGFVVTIAGWVLRGSEKRA